MKYIFFKRFLSLFFTLHFLSEILWAAPESKPVVDHPKVTLEEIKLQKDQKRIVLPLKVEPKIQSLVSADLEGNVTRILKPLGATVKSGEVVLYLENRDPGFTYAPVPVRAPVSGILSQIWTTQMSKVNRGDKLFTVINPKDLKLTGEIPSSDLRLVHSGLKGKLSVESLKAHDFAIQLVGVSPLLDTRTGTASAEFEFIKSKAKSDLKDFLLPPIGSVGQAVFEIDQGEIILVPEAALIYRDGKPMVRILKGSNQFSKKIIELGEQRDSNYVIKSGITQGEKVIVRSSRPLKEGEIIEIEKPATQIQ